MVLDSLFKIEIIVLVLVKSIFPYQLCSFFASYFREKNDCPFCFPENRFTPIYDFGYVALEMGWVFAEDSGEYLCRATNLYGMDETRAFIKSTSKPGVIYESQIPKGMQSLEKIRELEATWNM